MRTLVPIFLLAVFVTALAAPDATAQPEPKTAKELVERGEKALKDGNFLNASRDFSEALALDAKSAAAFHGRGKARFHLEFLDKAVEDLTEALRLNPEYAPALATRGGIYARQGRPDKALTDLNAAIKLNAKSAEALGNRGIVYAQMGEFEKAIKDFDAGIAIDSKDAKLFSNRSGAYFATGNSEKALADISEAIKLDPKNPALYRNRSSIFLRQGTGLATALKDLDEAIKLAPKDPVNLYQRANLQFARGEWAEVRKDIDEAIKLGPNIAQLYIARAGLLACCPDDKHRDAKQAFQDADRACELTEWKDPFALEALAAAAAALGDFPGAVKWQKKALEDPDYARGAGYARARLAAFEAKRAVRLAPPIRDRNDAGEFVSRGNYFYLSGEYESAIADYDAAIKLDPKNAKAFYGRACARTRRDEDSKAIADFTEAIKLDPKDVSSYADRHLVRMIRGEWELALADCDTALKLDPKNVTALTHRAMLYASCSDPTYRDANKALKDARAACDLTNWKAGYPLEAYAAACATAGDFDEAVKWQTRAATDEKYAQGHGASLRYRMQLYEAKKPLRTGPGRKPD